MEKYDFSGWATRNDLLCTDGRTIKRDAFKSQNGQTVPLIWGHNHSDPNCVLGHGVLENRDEGVYATVVSMTANLDRQRRSWFSMETFVRFLFVPVSLNRPERMWCMALSTN